MKNSLVMILVAVTCWNTKYAVADPATIPRTQLQSATGDAKATAETLLKAIDEQSRSKIRAGLKALIVQGRLDLALTVLDDPLDDVKQEAASAVADVKSKKVAEHLLAAYADLDYDVYGGTESQGRREQTIGVFEAALSKLTGATPAGKRTRSQAEKTAKVKVFTEALQQLPN